VGSKVLQTLQNPTRVFYWTLGGLFPPNFLAVDRPRTTRRERRGHTHRSAYLPLASVGGWVQ